MARLALTYLAAVGLAVVNATEDAASASSESSTGEASSQGAVKRLFNTLFVSFTSVFIGYAAVRLKLIVKERGDMKGLTFLIGQIVFPVLIFECVATAKLGDVDIGTLAACTLGKGAVYVATWLVAYLAYKPWCNRGERCLTATVFAWFSIASNDFAIGFPVVDALYGKKMDMGIYLAGNALVDSAIFVPITFVLFTLGRKMEDMENEDTESHVRPSRRRQAMILIKDLLTNPVMLMTLVGVAYKLVFGFTLVEDGIQVHLPSPLTDLVELLTRPFGMCALFICGANLANFEISVWPVVLVLMKVVLSAYITYFFAGFMINDGLSLDTKRSLHNFSFLYGMIPASSSPLIFAQQFSPSCTVEVATGIMLSMVTAGPMMCGAALFLEAATTDMASTLTSVMLTTAIASLLSGVVFLAMVAAIWRVWDLSCPGRALILSYAAFLMVYEGLMLTMNPHVRLASCQSYNANQHSVISTLLGWTQNSSQIMIIFLQCLVATRNSERFKMASRKVSLAAVSISVLGGILPALLTIPNTVTEMCSVVSEYEGTINVWPNAIWVYCLLLTMIVIGMYDMVVNRQNSSVDEPATPSSCASHKFEDEQKPRVVCARALPAHIIRGLSLLQFVRLLIRVVNTSQVLLGEYIMGSFAEMLVIEGVLEHVQLQILIVLMISDVTFAGHLSKRVQGMVYFLCKSSIEIMQISVEDGGMSPVTPALGLTPTACSLRI
eukprot:TRINITY_DN6212_c0_g1_i2.p1 TRINITY_DN6212_c0_g1~~TRINITY_DN6212_c0_g1_i2.p1  ORF type:complete len:740 (-),score=92.50 TRINITY_DN6212_c0_g1_i2:158-2323(-)